MSTKLVYNDKPIDLYQTVKIEEDITVVNIPNFRDVGIEPMAKLILKELGPWCEIKDISAWRRFYNNQYLPYGIKVLVKKNNIEIDLPSFLDHENGESMHKLKFSFNSSNAEAPLVSAAPQTDDSKSVTIEAQPSTKPVEKSKIINDTEVSTNDEVAAAKPGTINRLRGTVGLKKNPSSSLNAAVMPQSSNEKVLSGDYTDSDGSDDDNNQPIINL
ncbi:hypothetical protein AYI70_g3078 [Smittium culicis]|uniref:Uncharacterized protein n=1 Tax=Smittium culicis TaxID=133412 RepID=A0A1R1Y5E0_9FUNG|nr:hypothetical protein AYI70_g3078 [Smittium culicis]